MVSAVSHLDLMDVLGAHRTVYDLQEDIYQMLNAQTYVNEEPSTATPPDDQRNPPTTSWVMPNASSSNVGELEDFFDWGAAGLVDFGAELRGRDATSNMYSLANYNAIKIEEKADDAVLLNYTEHASTTYHPAPTREDSACSSKDHQPATATTTPSTPTLITTTHLATTTLPLSTHTTTTAPNATHPHANPHATIPIAEYLHMLPVPILNAPPPPPPQRMDSCPLSDATCSAMSTKLARAASIQRYRAKRARRVFKKKIRYQSRKTYAEARPRIRGRFARRDELVMLAAGGEEEEEGGGEMQHEDLSV